MKGFVAVFAFCIGFTAFSQKNAGTLIVKINPIFNGKALKLSNQFYVNENGDSLFIDVFKFYLSDIVIAKETDGKFTEHISHHLINAEDSNSLKFIIKNVSAGLYKKIEFNIGVDSLTNTSGALGGDLDPTKGMYWAWNTGYIAAKLEGHSKVCKTLHNAFEFHIGGYLHPYNSLRKVSLTISELKIIPGKASIIELNADVSEWFKYPKKIELSEINNIVLPNKNSVMMADNYADMFSLLKISNP